MKIDTKMNNVRTLIVQFKNEIAQWEIPFFRGAVIGAMENANVLFHNHMNDDQFRYRYPLIQYKRVNKRATMVCVGDGTEAIGEFFNRADFDFQIGDRLEKMEIDRIEAKHTLTQIWDEEFRYVIRKWLPLSSDNYRSYRSLDGIVEQADFLQRVLVGNILSFCKGLDITIEKEIKCSITNILNTSIYTHKGVKMMGFDVEFKSNVSLPDYVGLGKGVSLGFGMVKRMMM